MIQTEKVENFLQSVKLSGEADKPALNCAFYVTPLTHDILYELDDRIAKQLFRKEGGNQIPVAELDDVTLNLGSLGVHNLEWFPHNSEGADGAGQLTAGCVIGKVEASKLFADKPDWSLIWHVTIPMDSHSIELVRKYYKKTVFLTLVKAQENLFDESDGNPKPVKIDESTVELAKMEYCNLCKAKAAWLASDGKAWCHPHVSSAVGTEVLKIQYAAGVKQ